MMCGGTKSASSLSLATAESSVFALPIIGMLMGMEVPCKSHADHTLCSSLSQHSDRQRQDFTTFQKITTHVCGSRDILQEILVKVQPCRHMLGRMLAVAISGEHPTSLDAPKASSAGLEVARRICRGCTDEAALDTFLAADMTESGSLPW